MHTLAAQTHIMGELVNLKVLAPMLFRQCQQRRRKRSMLCGVKTKIHAVWTARGRIA